MKLTLEKVAKLAGVSRSTVSRVVNNQESVRPEVRKRVLAIIEETGYQPNLAARSLASKRSNILGLVIPRTSQNVFTDPYFPRLVQGITRACNARQYTLSLFLFHTEDEEKQLYPRVLRNGFVDGVILTSAVIDDPLIPQLVDSQIPFVVIGQPENTPLVSFVDVDNLNGALTAVTHLIQLGYTRIATITGSLNTNTGIVRLQGYRDALNQHALSIDENLIVSGDFSETAAYEAMQQLLPYQPDAVFAASDAMALGAIRAIREADLTIPDDIAVVGFDDLPVAAIGKLPLTTVRQSIRQTGALAVETLIDILNNGLEPPRQIVLSTELIIRSTCGSS